MPSKKSIKKMFSREGVAIIVVACFCLLVVVSMYIYVDKHLDSDKVTYEVSYEQKEIPSFNKEKYNIELDN